MADDFDLTDFGESIDAIACIGLAQCISGAHWGHVKWGKLDPALAGRRLLEDQTFVLADVAPRLFDSIGQC
jgi:hypothetical protein